MNEGRPLREVGAGDVWVVAEHRRAEHEHEIVSRQRLGDPAGAGGEKPLVERVVLRKARQPRQRCRPDGGTGALGQGHDRVQGARALHVAADDQGGSLRRGEPARDLPCSLGGEFRRDGDAAGANDVDVGELGVVQLDGHVVHR